MLNVYDGNNANTGTMRTEMHVKIRALKHQTGWRDLCYIWFLKDLLKKSMCF